MARPRSEEARRKVFDAARAHLSDSGVLDFTIEAISRHSGVAKTTIYRHWQSTAELLHDTVASLIQPFQTPDTGSLRGDLLELQHAMVPVFNQPTMYRMLVGLLARSAEDPKLDALKNRLVSERQKPLLVCIERAVERGEITADVDVMMIADLLEGPMLARRLVRGEPIDLDEAERMLDLQLDGLLTRRR